jgi:hypothetical protein
MVGRGGRGKWDLRLWGHTKMGVVFLDRNDGMLGLAGLKGGPKRWKEFAGMLKYSTKIHHC